MDLYDSNGTPLLAPGQAWDLDDSTEAKLFDRFGGTMYETHLRFEWDSDNQSIIDIVDGVSYRDELGNIHKVDIPVPDSWDSGQFTDLRLIPPKTLLKWAKAQESNS